MQEAPAEPAVVETTTSLAEAAARDLELALAPYSAAMGARDTLVEVARRMPNFAMLNSKTLAATLYSMLDETDAISNQRTVVLAGLKRARLKRIPVDIIVSLGPPRSQMKRGAHERQLTHDRLAVEMVRYMRAIQQQL